MQLLLIRTMLLKTHTLLIYNQYCKPQSKFTYNSTEAVKDIPMDNSYHVFKDICV